MSSGILSREATYSHPNRRQLRQRRSFETLHQLPNQSKKKLGRLALVGVAGLGAAVFGMGGHTEAKNDSCTDESHQLIAAKDGGLAAVQGLFESLNVKKGEQTAAGVAKKLTSDRGYSISKSQLLAANSPKMFNEGKFISGEHCVEVPGPTYSGFTRADGDTSLAEFAEANLTTVENLHKLNPALENIAADKEIADGKIVRVDLAVDTDYVYREMSRKEGDINTMANKNARLRNQILAKNGSILGSGGAVNSGSDAWLPVIETEWMKDHDMQPQDIADAFPISSYTKPSSEREVSRSAERRHAVLSGFEAGFAENLLKIARTEIKRWPDGETDNKDGVENSNPYIKKYTGGPLGLKESWCADFVRYALNGAGAGIDTQETIDGKSYVMRRVRDVYNWMVDGENGSFYVYKRDDILDNHKTSYRPGDIIFFNYDGSEDKFMASDGNHIGIISGVDGGKLKIIDGNYYKRDDVSERTISAHDSQIMAIARPLEAKEPMTGIDVPPQQQLTHEQSVAATDALYERGPEWQNRASAMRFFIDYGLEDYQAAGLVGNFVIEAGNDPRMPAHIEQYGGGPGRGIAQWEKGGRFDHLEAFANKHNLDWAELETQLAFVIEEFETTERSAYEWLKGTPGVYEATDAVLNGYERPAQRIIRQRLIEAQKILAAYRLAAQ